MLSLLRVLLVAVLALCMPGLVRAAQPQAGAALVRLVAGGDPKLAPESTSGHGWVFLPTPNAEAGAPDSAEGYLVHMVPRQGVQRASAGSVRLVMALTRSPLAITGWGGEVTLLMGVRGDTATGPGLRTLSSLRVSGPMSLGNWDYKPMERLELKASLPPDVTPRSMVGTSAGTVMVWERSEAVGGALEAALLGDDLVWRVMRAPPGTALTGDGGELHALATSEGVMLAVRGAGEATMALWRATEGLAAPRYTPADAPAPMSAAERRRARANGTLKDQGVAAQSVNLIGTPLTPKWVREGTVRLPSAVSGGVLRTIGPSAPHWLVREGGQTLLAARTLAGLTVWRLDTTDAEPTVLWTSGELPADVGMLTVGGLDACAVLSFVPEHGSGGGGSGGAMGGGVVPSMPDAGHLRVVEVSASTGAVLSDVAAHTDGFLSRRELWILWLLFIGVGVVVLLVVVNADGPQEVQLPEGFALATPARRALAGVLDLAAAVGLTTLVVGGTPGEWLSPATSASSSLVPLVSVIGFAFALSTLGEFAMGASPGKLLVGARVLGLEPVAAAVGGAGGARGAGKKEKGQPTVMRAGPARFYQVLIRNAIRWFMPPMGLAMIADDNWRHPGDQLGRTVVVVRFEAEDEVGGEDEE